jgi:molecular chaperone GrpE
MSKKTSLPKDSGNKEVAELRARLSEAQAKELRALADYQNLIRRSQEDRAKFIQMANRDVLEALLQPLEHLEMAATQNQDKGVMMVLEQLKKTLAQFGLQEIEVAGKEFDVATMEAVEGSVPGKKVAKVVRKGYILNGSVIQHAQVVLG